MILTAPVFSVPAHFGERLLVACVLLATTLMVSAQQAEPEVDVKYSDLYQDLVFEDKGEDWRKDEPAANPWRNQPEVEKKSRWSSGFDPAYQADREGTYVRQGADRYQYNDPKPTSILRYEFK